MPKIANSYSTEALGTKSSEIMLETFHMIMSLPLHQKCFPDSPMYHYIFGMNPHHENVKTNIEEQYINLKLV